MQAIRDTGFVVAGNQGVGAAFLRKTDALGDEEWSRTYTETDQVLTARVVLENPAGGFVVAGSRSAGAYLSQGLILFVDASGAEQRRALVGPIAPFGLSEITALLPVAGGGWIAGGTTGSSFLPGSSSPFVVRLAADGSTLWQVTPTPATSLTSLDALAPAAGGSFVAAGSALELLAGVHTRFQLWKFDDQGHEIWHRDGFAEGAITPAGGPVGVAATPTGFVLAGTGCAAEVPCATTAQDAVLEAVDADGAFVREARIGGTANDGAFCAAAIAGGGVALAGYTESYGAGGRDAYVVTTGPDLTTGPPPA